MPLAAQSSDWSRLPGEDESAAPTHRSADRSLLYPSLAKSVVGGLVAVAVILSAFVLINFVQKDDADDAPAPGASRSASRGPSAAAGTTSGSQSSDAPPVSSPDDESPAISSKPAPKPKPKPAPKPAVAADSRSPAAAAVRVPLTVLNHSRIKDLAKAAAGDFRAVGWSVGEDNIANTTYRAIITTVYYLPGQEAAALQLMRDVPKVQRMRLRPRGLPGRGLTVVVTREYVG